MAMITTEGPRNVGPTAIKRISWGAIFAGLIIVLVVQLSLSLFGIGIGASTIDPLHGETPAASSFAIGAVIWWIVASMIAFASGGWVAGRLAGMPQQTDGLLHGLITWGAATLVTVYFLTSAAGSILGGTFGVIGQALAATGQGAAALAPNVTDMVTKQLQDTDVTWEEIKQEARILLQQTGKEQLEPEALENKANKTKEDITESAHQSVRNPQQSDDELLTVLDQVIRKGKNLASEVDREAVVNILVSRTNLSQQEAEQAVKGWADTYQMATEKYNDLKGQATQQAREAADATAEGVSQAAIWSFITLIFGASAAAIGGIFGAPRDLVAPVPPSL